MDLCYNDVDFIDKMHSTPYEIALIGIGGTVVGALLGACLTYIFSLTLANKNAKRFAAMKLREAFGSEVAKLSHPEKLLVADSSRILERSFEKHQVAVNEFKFFLKGQN